MKAIIQIDIVSDISCPWCVIGYKSLITALNMLAIPNKITWYPFELNPLMPAGGQPLDEHLHEKYGSTKDQVEQIQHEICKRGDLLEFPFNFKKCGRIYNTFNAHRMLHWSRQFKKQTELKLALFDLYFGGGGNPDNMAELLNVVAEIGLSSDKAKLILESDLYVNEVRAEEAKFLKMGINMIPTFIINNKYKITGGQTVEKFMEILHSIGLEEGIS